MVRSFGSNNCCAMRNHGFLTFSSFFILFLRKRQKKAEKGRARQQVRLFLFQIPFLLGKQLLLFFEFVKKQNNNLFILNLFILFHRFFFFKRAEKGRDRSEIMFLLGYKKTQCPFKNIVLKPFTTRNKKRKTI